MEKENLTIDYPEIHVGAGAVYGKTYKRIKKGYTKDGNIKAIYLDQDNERNYEVVIIREKKSFDGEMKPTYPSTSEWGKWATSHGTFERALKKFKSL
ncbi:MAG: hypothetical protein MPJ25_01655 [Pirellulales bacterium]|nr:hypothetical protein [Pirellulales bacterium]